MRQSLIITIAATFLLVAVLCTAGCVSTSDPIVGDWVAEDDTSVLFVTFAEDKSGYFISGLEKSNSFETDFGYSVSSSSQMVAETFNWTAVEPKKTYTLAFVDGTTKTASLNVERGLLTIDGVEYQEVLNKFSGSTTQKATTTQEKPQVWTDKHV